MCTLRGGKRGCEIPFSTHSLDMGTASSAVVQLSPQKLGLPPTHLWRGKGPWGKSHMVLIC